MIRDVIRYVERRLAGIRLAYRAKLSALGKGAAVQLVQAEALADETIQAVELFQHFGFTSGPPAGTQIIVVPLGGSTAHSVIIATEHGAYRVDVQSGEACVYSMWGDKVHLKQELIEVETKTLHIKASERVIAETKTFLVKAGEQVIVETETFRVKADAQIVFETPSFTMQAEGGGAAAATMEGSLHTTGAITSDADHVAGGVSAMHHTHPGDSGGVTGEPM